MPRLGALTDPTREAESCPAPAKQHYESLSAPGSQSTLRGTKVIGHPSKNVVRISPK